MADTADVVVIGGGVIGVSIAYALAATGVKRVVLVEKGALASGASGRSSALIRMHYTNEEDARLAWASFPVFRDWPELHGRPARLHPHGLRRRGRPRGCRRRCARTSTMLRGIGVDTTALSPAGAPRLSSRSSTWTTSAPPPTSRPAATRARPTSWKASAVGRRSCGAHDPPVDAGARASSGARARWSGVETRAGPHRRGRRGRGRGGVGAAPLPRDRPRRCRARPKALDTMLVTRPPEMADAAHGRSSITCSGRTSGRRATCSRSWACRARCGTSIPTRCRRACRRARPAEGAQILTHRIPAMERATLCARLSRVRLLQRRSPRHPRRGRAASTGSISPPPSAAPASRSRPRSARAWPS